MTGARMVRSHRPFISRTTLILPSCCCLSRTEPQAARACRVIDKQSASPVAGKFPSTTIDVRLLSDTAVFTCKSIVAIIPSVFACSKNSGNDLALNMVVCPPQALAGATAPFRGFHTGTAFCWMSWMFEGGDEQAWRTQISSVILFYLKHAS